MEKLITGEILAKTAELARFNLSEKEEEELLADLGKILEYFGELKELNTESVEPMAGGTEEKNVFRADERRERDEKAREKERENIVAAFPEKEERFLKVPPVFE
ncbi:MAG: Asp-tRNA(Asn)/Glu-tRNA(Gln) amidotransferase subunit GatC [Patescibacteria group bacterium]